MPDLPTEPNHRSRTIPPTAPTPRRDLPPNAIRKAVGVLDRTVTAAERALLLLAGCAVVATMVLTTVSAITRYLFSAPIHGTEVWAGEYLAPAITYLALASALSHRHHVGVSIVVQHLGRRTRRYTQILAALIVAVTFAVLAYQSGLRASESYSTGQIEPTIGVPLWIAYAVVPIGCTVLALRAALLAVTWWLDGSSQIGLAQRADNQADSDAGGNAAPTERATADAATGDSGRP